MDDILNRLSQLKSDSQPSNLLSQPTQTPAIGAWVYILVNKQPSRLSKNKKLFCQQQKKMF